MYRSPVLAIVLMTAAPAMGQTITNYSFETGDFTGWTEWDSGSNADAYIGSVSDWYTYDGSYVAVLYTKNSGTSAYIESDLALVTHHTMQFWGRHYNRTADLELGAYDSNGYVGGFAFTVAQSSSFTGVAANVEPWCGESLSYRVTASRGSSGTAYTILDHFRHTGQVCAEFRDDDGDGYCPLGEDNNADGDCADAGEQTSNNDCNDNNSSIYPGASETVGDGIDQDCDGFDDCYQDSDNDGWGTDVIVTAADCVAAGEAVVNGDCDDNEPAAFPSGSEVCDGIDNDCDTRIDEGLVFTTYYRDSDNDSVGDTNNSQSTCDGQPSGYVTVDGDCDDTTNLVSPLLSETTCDGLDNDCDAATVDDADADGDGVALCSGDCDDDNVSVYPGATEVCDGVDNDCNGEDDAGGFDGSETDDDGDGQSECENDCDDNDANNFSGNPELCDNADNDCDGTPDNGVVYIDYYPDGDGDGFGVPGTPISECAGAPLGYAPNDTDCNDSVASIYPGATEAVGDGVDQDCDGGDTCWTDSDNDDYGSTDTVDSVNLSCNDPGEAAISGDCDDDSASVYPGAPEVTADGIDQDCNNQETCYADLDNDQWGSSTLRQSNDLTCSTNGVADVDGDCNDSRPDINPSAPEDPANGIDQDCNGTEQCYQDRDGDGRGSSTLVEATQLACDGTRQSNFGDDCDDNDASAYPGATEAIADGVDQDCDGGDVCYRDGDSDSYGSSVATVVSDDLDCLDPNETADNTDCNDARSDTYPGAPEVLDDGIDQDCSGTDSITCYADADGDGFGDPAVAQTSDIGACGAGYAINPEDCDDTDPDINPNSNEIPGDGIDQDCTGDDLTGCYEDLDGDGYGTGVVIGSPDALCTDPGESYSKNDCDDESNAIYPGAPNEVCGDGIDTNCDGAGGPGDDEDGDTLDQGLEIAFGTDPCVADTDGDNLLDNIEALTLRTNPLDPDTDGDTVPDDIEVGNDVLSPRDSDRDGVIDAKDDDDDNDRIPTSYEATLAMHADTDNDGIPNYRDEDDDNDFYSTSPDEDRDRDGDPTNDNADGDNLPDYLDPDDDNDGVPSIDEYVWGSSPTDSDSDFDGVDDLTEFGSSSNAQDTDGDGLVNLIDGDDDGDGIDTVIEGSDDFDGDGTPNYLDLDADNDGNPDAIEGTGDQDGDGAPNFLDPSDLLDQDGDGLDNADELALGTDPLVADSDGDGRLDGLEVGDPDSAVDTDRDGIIDALDADDDNDGVPTLDEDVNGNGDYDDDDTDGDATPNWADDDEFDGPLADADGDGITNGREEELGLGVYSADSDGDGIEDRDELDGAEHRDTDGDGTPDANDPDDDGDGIPTATEGAGDLDGDGIPNYLDTDVDGDDVLDIDEYGDGSFQDDDCDGIENWVDPDDADFSCDTSALDTGATATPSGSTASEGCGCNTGGMAMGWMVLLALTGLVRRRR